MQEIEKIWYACYGSNLLEERFLCYITGGKPAGSLRIYTGCSNKTLPLRSEKINIKAEMYFAKCSKTWNGGGAAFINPESGKDHSTLGKRYLIQRDQFTGLVKQEIRFEGNLKLDLNKAIRKGYLISRPHTWYGKILFLGQDEGIPIFTFTNVRFLKNHINSPDRHYLKIIINGLRETYSLSNRELLEYLQPKKGIKGTALEKQLSQLL